MLNNRYIKNTRKNEPFFMCLTSKKSAKKVCSEHDYDANRQRVLKIVKPRNNTTGALLDQSNWQYTYYVRDASGNVASIYTRSYAQVNSTTYTDVFKLQEQNLYGSSRLGTSQINKTVGSRNFVPTISGGLFTNYNYVPLNIAPQAFCFYSYRNDAQGNPILMPCAKSYTRTLGDKRFELNNHLASVLTVVSDRKLQHTSNNTLVDFYRSEILETHDTYAFGSPMPGRKYNSGNYRYGYQNQEKDNEIYGDGNAYAFEYRIEDARLGRFLSTDPLESSFPWNSPYAFSENRVTNSIELEGLEAVDLYGGGSVNHSQGEQGPQPQSNGTVYGPYQNHKQAALSGNASIDFPDVPIESARHTGMPSFVKEPNSVDHTILNQGIESFAPQKVNVPSGSTEWEKNLAQYNFEVETNRWNNLNYEQKWNEAYQGIMMGQLSDFAQQAAAPVAELYTIQAQLGGSGMASGLRLFPRALINTVPKGKLANHIFSGRAGKLLDTPTNRTILEKLSNNAKNLMGVDPYGKSWYAKTLDDGTQIYSYTQDGVIKGAGINKVPLDMVKTQKLK